MSDAYSKNYQHGWSDGYRWESKSLNTQANSYVSNSGNGGTGFTSYTDSLSGYRNPSWRDQVRMGLNATTPLVASRFSHEPHAPMSATYFRLWKHSQLPFYLQDDAFAIGTYRIVRPPALGSPATSTRASVENRCIRKFLDRYSSIRSSFEAGQDFGEYRATFESIRHPLKSLQQGLVSYLSTLGKRAKGLKKTSPKLPKILADTYLEHHFGWKPLVDDIVQGLVDIGRYRFPHYPIRVSAKEIFDSDVGAITSSIAGIPGSIRIPYKTTHKYSVRMLGVVRSNAVDGQISLAQSLQLTPRDWLPTAWDLLPYSWIADYFANVGDILQSLAFRSADLVWGCRTNRILSKTEVGPLSPVNPVTLPSFPYQGSPAIVTVNGGNYECYSVSVNRAVLDPSIDLLPRFELRVPTGKYPYYNLGALLVQRASSLVPYYRR